MDTAVKRLRLSAILLGLGLGGFSTGLCFTSGCSGITW
jgi:hypothetical protein